MVPLPLNHNYHLFQSRNSVITSFLCPFIFVIVINRGSVILKDRFYYFSEISFIGDFG